MNENYIISPMQPFGAVPSARQICHLRDYNKKAFFHFGINTFTDSEWGDGSEDASCFAPTETDVRQWIKSIKAAGFNFAILTAKHHDGFCLWPSKYTEQSIKNSPYKNGKGDIVREFTDACHEMDIKCGIYLSPWDRNSPYWKSPEYSKFYNDQLTELMTEYGRIDEVWWDGAGSKETPYDWGLWAYTIRNYQPNAVIFGSLGAAPYVECHWVGNEAGFAGDPHYPTVSSKTLEIEISRIFNSGEFGADRFVPAEVDVSIRPGWFYHENQDDEVKSVKKLVDIWFKSIGRSCMMLLNFPPDRRGLLPQIDIDHAIEADRIIKQTFAVNYALGGKVISDSVYDAAHEPDYILNDSYDTFFVASNDNTTPTIEINLPHEVEFDTFAIGEKVELGIRVKGYRVEALVECEWKVLADKKSIGFLWTERFERVKTDKVRIVIYDSAAAPAIRTFGLYKMPNTYYDMLQNEKAELKKAVDIAHLPTSKVIQEDDGFKVEFGGIYPFNTVCFNGLGIWSYEILAFDGADYFSVYKGSKPSEREVVRLPETVEYSYQIKLVTNRKNLPDPNIEIFEL